MKAEILSMLGANAPFLIGEIMFNLFFSKKFSNNFRERIRADFFEAEKYFSKYYDFSGCEIDIYFADISKMEDKDISEPLKNEKISGMAFSGFDALIIEVLSENFSKKELFNTLFHELNHQFRAQIFPPENNIWNDVILEGLALNFEKQASRELNYSLKFLTDYYEKPDEEKLKWGLKRILEIFRNGESYNHYNWYYNHFGEDPDLPTNFVYRVGEFLISKYCEKYNILSSEALRIPNEDFEKFARKEILCEE